MDRDVVPVLDPLHERVDTAVYDRVGIRGLRLDHGENVIKTHADVRVNIHGTVKISGFPHYFSHLDFGATNGLYIYVVALRAKPGFSLVTVVECRAGKDAFEPRGTHDADGVRRLADGALLIFVAK